MGTMNGKGRMAAGATEQELAEVRKLIEERTGILFDQSRERFFCARVREHIQEKGLAGGSELLKTMLRANTEYEALLEKLLTQETSFFRYPAVYQALEKRILPELQIKKFWNNPRSLRIWSAGCSTGEEPYSIAITLLDTLSLANAWNIEILATDVGRQALKIADTAIYSGQRIASVSETQLANYFTKVNEGYQVKPRIRKLVTFAPMNLAQAVYTGRMDLIVCMNVLIYFSEEKRNILIQRFFDTLEPGGYLLLGHSESLFKVPVKFQAIVLNECILYRKPASGDAQQPELVTEGRA